MTASFDWTFPHASQRMPVLARNVVATSQPLAAQAGLSMLARGGNAVDAALCAAITLTVVEPTSNGLGSDAFAILWNGSRLLGYNGSGRSPAHLTRDRFDGLETIPRFGWEPVTVPGAVRTWVDLSARFGALPFGDLFEPAVRYARDGFLVSPFTAEAWARSAARYADFPEFARAFLPGGRAPASGTSFRCPDQATTLELIAASGGRAFYAGKLADAMDQHAKQGGGTLRKSDLEAHEGEWVDTISTSYRDHTVHEIPPNGQGIAALIALGILDVLPPTSPDSAPGIHARVEAMKMGFADAFAHVGDPTAMTLEPEQLLDPERLAARARDLSMDRARSQQSELPPAGGTVYLATADESGMMVSFIQSNFWGFGSGIVVPGTGISLQNRGYGFTLTRGHPNEIGPSKRPFHTIIPGFVTRHGAPLMAFGVMGGHMQPQGHVQVLSRILDGNENPQSAIDAPRWHVAEDGSLSLEAGFPDDVREELRRRGHVVRDDVTHWGYGGAQAIYRLDDGYCAASDPRKDGQAVGF